MKGVTAAVFIAAAFIAGSKALEQFPKRRNGGCDDGDGGLSSTPDDNITAIIWKKYVSCLLWH